jgi:P27 family predicted phage terminase small subunit
MKGRKPTPPNLKVVTGNPGHREIPAGPDVAPAIPTKPTHLNGLAAQVWDEIAPELLTAHLINPLCGAILAVHCDAIAEYVHAKQMIERPADQGGGYLVKTPNGYEVQSPWVAIMNKAFERMMKTGVEFGMTPSSLARVSGSPQMPLFPDEDPMEAFLRANNGQARAKA